MALYAISGFVWWEQALPLPLLLWLSACTIPHKVKGSIKAVVVYGGGDLVVDYLKFQIMRYSKIPLFLNTSGFAFSYLLFDKFNPNVKCILDFESLFVVSLIYKFYIDWNKMNLTYIYHRNTWNMLPCKFISLGSVWVDSVLSLNRATNHNSRFVQNRIKGVNNQLNHFIDRLVWFQLGLEVPLFFMNKQYFKPKIWIEMAKIWFHDNLCFVSMTLQVASCSLTFHMNKFECK